MISAYRKMERRSIRGSYSRFFAIMCIVAIGTGFLAGLLATTPDMKDTANAFFKENKLYDFYIRSNLGMTKSDKTSVEKQDYINSATLLYEKDLLLEDKHKDKIETRLTFVDFNSFSVNKPVLIEGRMPKEEGECFVSILNPYNYKVKIGDVFTKNRTYKVVGKGMMPQFISTLGDYTNVGSGKIKLAVYTPEYEERNVYTAMYLNMKGNKRDVFSKGYKDSINKNQDNLEYLGEIRSKIRKANIVDEAQRKLDKEIKKYNQERNRAEKKLQDARYKLDNNKKKIKSGITKIDDGLLQIATNKAILSERKKEILANKADIDYLKAMKKAGKPLTKEMEASISKFDESVKKILKAEKTLEYKRSQLLKKKNQLEISKNQIESGYIEYRKNKEKVDEKFLDAKKKIDAGQRKIDNIKEGKWYIQSSLDNLGISRFKDDVEKVGAIAKIFPIFFFLVAALVALTTMTRMIEDDRTQIGCLKSLGYSNLDILSYYEKYGIKAALIGTFVGEIIGFKVFPKVISGAYTMIYQLPTTDTPIRFDIGIIVGIVTLLAIIISVYFSCKEDLKEKPAMLLLPKTPKSGKRILLERIKPLWNRIKFSHKVTLRNLFRYKKRFLMTVIGVAGCFALLLTGFGIRDAIGDIVKYQYEDIYKYDLRIYMEDGKDARYDWKEGKEDLESYTFASENQVDAVKKSEKYKANLIIPKNKQELPEFITLRNRLTQETLALSDNGAIISEKLSELLGVTVGDDVSLKLSSGKDIQVKISGICENYTGNNIYVSKGYYKRINKVNPVYNMILANESKDNKNSENIIETIGSDENVAFVSDSETVRKTFADSVKNIDYVVMVLIISAGALAMVVLYNLINVNICERKKELATVEVLGFFTREIYAYVFREIYILSFIGMLVGIPIGKILHRFVITTAEVGDVMFGRDIFPMSYVYSFGITIFFTILVNLLMRRVIAKIDMVESMKATD